MMGMDTPPIQKQHAHDVHARSQVIQLTDAEKLDELFSYHVPEGDQIERYQRLRTAAKIFANEILYSCPPSADRSAAVRLLRESLMTANAAVALKGLNL
jgi:hypothetical protein